MIDFSGKKKQARPTFRVIAGIVSLLSVAGIVVLLYLPVLEIWGVLVYVSIFLIGAVDFGAIALRGDGLILFKWLRRNKRKETENPPS